MLKAWKWMDSAFPGLLAIKLHQFLVPPLPHEKALYQETHLTVLRLGRALEGTGQIESSV